MTITQLGEARHASPVSFSVDDEIFTPADVQWPGGRVPEDLMLFEKAGPRQKLFFDPQQTRAAIVTCGGLCPGLNNVIRSVTRELLRGYGVKSVLGIRGGYRGLDPDRGKPPVELTEDMVEDIHKEGGTMLGTSRGPVDMAVAVEFLISREVNILFTVGGDGTQRGGNALFEEARKRGHALAVVGIPKTIDNDVRFVTRTFGYGTAVDEAVRVIDSAHTEARSVDNGVAVVKLMGRHAGFIAAAATVASQDVNFCLMPEVPFALRGPGGLLAALERRLGKKNHAVIVVAEGAGQELLGASGEKDASGNAEAPGHRPVPARRVQRALQGPRHRDDAALLRSELPDSRLSRQHRGRPALRPHGPSRRARRDGRQDRPGHQLPPRPVRPRAHRCHRQGSKRLDLDGELWRAVLSSTGQPQRFS